MEDRVRVLDYSIPFFDLYFPYNYFIEGESLSNQNIDYDGIYLQQEVGKLVDIQRFIKKYYYEDCIIVAGSYACTMTEYQQDYLLKSLDRSVEFNTKILYGNVCGIEQLIPLTENLNWIDHLSYSSFFVVFRSLYDEMLDTNIKDDTKFWDFFNNCTSQKVMMFPFLENFSKIEETIFKPDINKIEMIKHAEQYYNTFIR